VKHVPGAPLSVLILTVVLAAVTAVAGLPSWAAELVLLPFLGWLGIEVVRQGRQLKDRPTREEITEKETAAATEHRRLSAGMEEAAEHVADNMARIEGLTQRLDAQRRELDDQSAQLRRLGERIEDAKDAIATRYRQVVTEVDERLTLQLQRLEDRVNELNQQIERRQRPQ